MAAACSRYGQVTEPLSVLSSWVAIPKGGSCLTAATYGSPPDRVLVFQKLRASDGTSLGTFPATGAGVLAFDGTNVWVADGNGNTVTKLQASNGANLGTFKVGEAPSALVFDGSNIWTANSFGSSVTKLRASNGTTLHTITVGANPDALAYDGANIWVTTTQGVIKLRASDESTLGTFSVGYSNLLAFDGASVWVALIDNNAVSKF